MYIKIFVIFLLFSRYADDNLNRVAAELDSFDGRKDPERCAALVSRLRDGVEMIKPCSFSTLPPAGK